VGEVEGGGIALITVFRQRLHDDALNRGRHVYVGGDGAKRRGLLHYVLA
jgi:hypothetical protein